MNWTNRQVFGVGCAKSGTHSLAKIFQGALGSVHEPEFDGFIKLIQLHDAAQIDGQELANQVEKLIKKIDQPINISQINGYIVDVLYQRFPEAGYLFTVRDCLSWVRSFVNHQLTLPIGPQSSWQVFRDIRFQPKQFLHNEVDAPLQTRGLYALDAYLAYWMRHNINVLRTLCRTDFMIVPTNQISNLADEILRFAGARSADTSDTSSHDFAGRYVESPLDALDAGYLEDRIDQYTNELLSAAQNLLPPDKLAILQSAICAE